MKIPKFVSSIIAHSGFIKVEKATLDLEGRQIIRERILNKNAVGIFLFDKKKRAVVLLDQYRFPVDSVIPEIPAGQIDEGFSDIETAIKEVKEETGITIMKEDLVRLVSYHPAIGTSTERITIFYAPVDIDKIEKRQEDIENMQSELRIVSYSEMFEMIVNGDIIDGKSIIAFLTFQKFAKNNGWLN